jgi:hypothetical protein
MGKYNGAIVTSAGQSLIANAVASNQKIIFTKLKASTHVYASTTDFESMTSIADIVQSVDISYAGVYNNNVIQVSGQFTNTGVTTAFAINTIGLYGKVGNGAETLVAVVTAVNADTMPVADPVSPTSIIYNIQMTVQNSGVMEVEVNDAGTINVHQFNDALYSTAAITVPTTGWTASGSQYTKTIDVGGITSSSMPFVELQYPDNVTATQKKAIDKAASKLVSLTTTNYGQVVLTATEVPATSFNLLLRGLGSGQYTQPYNEFFTTVLDKEPYVSREARDGLVKIPQLVGATVAWNQLVQNGNFADGTDNWSKGSNTSWSVSDGVLTATPTDSTQGGNRFIYSGNKNISTNHKVLVLFKASGTSVQLQFRQQSPYNSRNINNFTLTNSLALYGCIGDSGQYSVNTIAFTFDNQPSLSLANVQCFDLTQMFGTAIADYIYSLETAEAYSGIAYLKSYDFFKKLYYGYDPGSLQSVCVSGRQITALDGTVRNYPIENVKLLGLFKLDANNKLYADGDIYPSSGSGTKKCKIVNLGDYTWTYVSATNTFCSDDVTSDRVKSRDLCGAICAKYVHGADQGSVGSNELSDKQFAFQYANNLWGRIMIKDTSYSDATVFKASLDGVYLAYELATPTTFSADPYINPQRSEGTEEFVDGLTRDVMIPVGNESTYFMSEVIPIISEYIDAVTSS